MSNQRVLTIAQDARGIDPQPVCRNDAEWAASGSGGWYVVVPLADGGDASTRGPVVPVPSAAGPGAGFPGAAVAEGFGTSTAIDWAQVETYERGYLVSPRKKAL